MKSIIWIQSQSPSIDDILAIDGVCQSFDQTYNPDDAISFLLQFGEKMSVKSFVSKAKRSRIIKEMNLPQNFNVYVDNSTLYLQGTLSAKDQYGRLVPFLLWCKNMKNEEILFLLEKIASESCMSLEKDLMEKYLKAIDSIYRSKMIINIVLIVSFILILFLLVWIIK